DVAEEVGQRVLVARPGGLEGVAGAERRAEAAERQREPGGGDDAAADDIGPTDVLEGQLAPGPGETENEDGERRERLEPGVDLHRLATGVRRAQVGLRGQ